MPTIRAPHNRGNQYFQMRRATAQDHALSWRARGIMAYLLSKPDGWECQEDDLIAEGGEGKHAVRVALAELKAAGYLTVTRERDPDTGEFRWVKTLHEEPIKPPDEPTTTRKSGSGPLPENQAVDDPATTRKSGSGPLPDLPLPENRVIHKRESLENTESPTPLPPTGDAVTPATPAGGGGDGHVTDKNLPGRTPLTGFSQENAELLRRAGVRSNAAINRAATLPMEALHKLIAQAQDRPREQRGGWIWTECKALLDNPDLIRTLLSSAEAPPPPRASTPPPLPDRPPLSADERRAILARRF